MRHVVGPEGETAQSSKEIVVGSLRWSTSSSDVCERPSNGSRIEEKSPEGEMTAHSGWKAHDDLRAKGRCSSSRA